MTPRRNPERRFGDFELLQRIGRDGPFHFFRARQEALDRLVILKVLPERTATLERAALLRREAEAAHRLDHPYALRVYEVGQLGGAPYLAFAHVDGEFLSERLKTNPLPPPLALDVTRQLAEVLLHAHDRGVLHGSLRPEAVWLTRDRQIRVAGFGCPIRFDEIDVDLVASWAGYLAPEQTGGRGSVGRPTDVHGLGALLYAMLTGGPPHEGATPAETFRLIRSQTPVRPSRLRPGLSTALDEICLRAMHILPGRRYGAERPLPRLMADLRRAGDGRDDADAWPGLQSWVRRHARLLRALALTLLLVVVPAAWDLARHRAAWDVLTRSDASADEYARAARHFERRAADEPADREYRAGHTLARLRTGQLTTPTAEPLAWPKNADSLTVVRRLTDVLNALKMNRRDAARAEFDAARAAGYVPQSEPERRLYHECERSLAGN